MILNGFPENTMASKGVPNLDSRKSKRRRIAASAMSQKAEGYEPSVEVTIARCPAATHNPQTRRPFCDKVIRKVFVEDCYDSDPESPWKLQYPLQKVFLPDKVKEHRVRMVDEIEALPNSSDAGWWYRYAVWFDPSQSIVARTRQQYDRMRRAELGNKKRYISDDAGTYSRNLRARKEALKQASYQAERISWVMILARGVVAVHTLPADWSVTGEGMAQFVAELP